MRAHSLIINTICLLLLSASCGNLENGPSTNAGIDNESLTWWLHQDFRSLVYVSWSQSSTGTIQIEYELDGEWHSTPPTETGPGINTQLIAGIPYGMSVSWRVVQKGGDTVIGSTITTDPAPFGLPVADLLISEEENWYSKGNYLLTSINQEEGGWCGGTYWTIIIDRKGRIVWANKTPLGNWTLYAQIAVSGDHILWDEATHWSQWDSGDGSKVHYTYLDGEFDVVPTPGLHHAFVQLPDGTLAWGDQGGEHYEILLEKAPGDSAITEIWSSAQDWPTGGSMPESNGLFYVESTNTFLYSFYTNSSIVELDRETGESIWWAGGAEAGYSFDPEESQYFWQHGVSYTEDGTLLVSTESNDSTKVHEYEVNHDNETLTLVWSYDPGIEATTNGDAWRLENGNTLHVIGSSSHITEVDPDGTIIWRVAFPGEFLLGRGEFIEDLYTLMAPQ